MTGTAEMSALARPGRIGTMTVDNRIVIPPMLVGYGSEDGYVTDRALDYYRARALGGAGLVIVEASMPIPAGKMFRYYLDCSSDDYLPGLTRLAETIKDGGARAAIQLGDGGREVRRDLTGRAPMGPSPIAARKREVPIEMTHDDIRNAVDKFAEATVRARMAGFDGVEMHAAHVYLLSQFLSGFSNHRTDEYGGSVENRFRIMIDLIREVRRRVGDDYPVWLRINGVEFDTPGGVTIEDAQQYARLAEEYGYDAISVSAGSPHYEATMPTMYSPPKSLADVGARIKEAVDFPVMVAGRLDAVLGEEILTAGDADFICIGRGTLADPDLPRKALAGRIDDVRPAPCLLDCVHRGVLRDTPITCMVNPTLGREHECRITQVDTARRVAIVGGGVGGMEAALVAAQRGHDVTVFDRDEHLGGRMRLDAASPGKSELLGLIGYYERQLLQQGATVVAGTEVSPRSGGLADAEVIVVASGARCDVERTSTDRFVFAEVAMVEDVPTDARIVILGGDARSLEIADRYAAGAGNRVTVVSRTRRLATSLPGIVRTMLMARLEQGDVEVIREVEIGAIRERTVIVTGDEADRTLRFDRLVFSEQSTPSLELLQWASDQGKDIYLVGDVVERREHIDSIADGSRVGRLI